MKPLHNPPATGKQFVKAKQKEKVHIKEKSGSKEDVINFIKQFEGLHTKAYWDIKQWSIGLGTKSYKGEVISEDEAYKRSYKTIDNIIQRYNLNKEHIEVQKAVVSFVYNIGSLRPNQVWLLKNKKYKALGNNFKQYVYCGGVICGGLLKRRNAEANLLHKF